MRFRLLTLAVTLACAVGLSACSAAARVAGDSPPATAPPADTETASSPDLDVNVIRSARTVRPGDTFDVLVGVRNNGPGTTRPAGLNEAGIGLSGFFGLQTVAIRPAADLYPQVSSIRAILWPRSVIDNIQSGDGRLLRVTYRVPSNARPGHPVAGVPLRQWPEAFQFQASAWTEGFDGPVPEAFTSVRFLP
jgi:hypothetical protein